MILFISELGVSSDTLELEGKNPMLVFKDVNINRAVAGAKQKRTLDELNLLYFMVHMI